MWNMCDQPDLTEDYCDSELSKVTREGGNVMCFSFGGKVECAREATRSTPP